jgi:hypothetical protein
MSDAATQHANRVAEDARKADADRRHAAREQVTRETAVHRELRAQAEMVMATSKPTPTQEECDLLRVGALHPDDVQQIDQPEMPHPEQQRAKLAEAAGVNRGAYQTREARPSQTTAHTTAPTAPTTPAQPAPTSPTPPASRTPGRE